LGQTALITLASIGHVLGSPIWPVLLGLVAIVVSLELFRRGRVRRRLTCSVTTRSLLNAEPEVAGEVEILYRDEPVRHVHLVTATIANRGNTVILAADFEHELTITLPGSGRLLTAELQEVRPESLAPTLVRGERSDEPQILIEPLLLNPGDSFTASAMVANYAGEVDVSGRIAGIRDLVEESGDDWLRWEDVVEFMVGAAMLAVFLAFLIPFVIHRWNGSSHNLVDFVLDRSATDDYHTAELATGRRVCVRLVGFDGTHQILAVKRDSSDRLLSVVPADIHFTGDRC
jgi:hypothetical protein